MVFKSLWARTMHNVITFNEEKLQTDIVLYNLVFFSKLTGVLSPETVKVCRAVSLKPSPNSEQVGH